VRRTISAGGHGWSAFNNYPSRVSFAHVQRSMTLLSRTVNGLVAGQRDCTVRVSQVLMALSLRGRLGLESPFPAGLERMLSPCCRSWPRSGWQPPSTRWGLVRVGPIPGLWGDDGLQHSGRPEGVGDRNSSARPWFRMIRRCSLRTSGPGRPLPSNSTATRAGDRCVLGDSRGAHPLAAPVQLDALPIAVRGTLHRCLSKRPGAAGGPRGQRRRRRRVAPDQAGTDHVVRAAASTSPSCCTSPSTTMSEVVPGLVELEVAVPRSAPASR
jgi:hypothetical protein